MRSAPSYIPGALRDKAHAARLSINDYCKAQGFSDQWAYKFFRRRHKDLLPYLRISKALGFDNLEDFYDAFEAGTLRQKMYDLNFPTIAALSSACDVDRDIIADVFNQSRSDLAIYRYKDTANKLGLSIDILAEPHFS